MTLDADRDRGGTTVRHEEELVVDRAEQELGAVRAKKHVDHERETRVVTRHVEHADVERLSAADADSGEVEFLPDGSVSIPILEEELVVTKRLVVRERIVIRKRTTVAHEQIDAELRKERVELEADPALDVVREDGREPTAD